MKTPFLRILILLTWAVTAYAQSTTTGLVLSLPFKNNANDESGLNNVATVNGATLTTDRFGNANSAYSFDGVDDYISIPSNTDITINKSRTISMWINIDSANLAKNYTTILSKEVSGYTYPTYHFQLLGPIYGNDKNKIAFLFGSGYTNYVNKSDKLYSNYLNKWIKITSIYSQEDGYLTLYLNDTICSKIYAGKNLTSNTDTYVPLYVGRGHNSSKETFFKGKIDEIKIYNRALTVSELSNITTPISKNQIFRNEIKITTNKEKKQITINITECPELDKNSQITITNVLGQIVYNSTINNIVSVLNLKSSAKSDLFIIQIKANNKPILSKKVIL